MPPDEFLNLPDEEQSALWDTLADDDKAAVLAHCRDQDEIKYDAELLANGVQPDEIGPRRKAIDNLANAAGTLGESGQADRLYIALVAELEGEGMKERTETLLAQFRESVRAFELAIGRAQLFVTETI